MTRAALRPDPADPASGPAPAGRRRPSVRPTPAAPAALAALAALVAWPSAARPAGQAPVDRDARDAAALRAGGDTTTLARALADRSWQDWVRDGAAMSALFTLDRPVRTAAREVARDATESSAADRVADRAEWFGDWQGSLPWVVGGSLAVGQLTAGADGLGEAASLLAGTAAAAAANEALNRAVGRGRPSWEEGALHVDPFRGHAAFPSGHTAYVFGVASGVDAVTEGWAPAAAAYGVAGLTGLSRIYHDRHWLTDVVAGAALGTVVSRLATREALGALGLREPGRDVGGAGSAGRAPGLRVEPLVAPRALGVTLRF